MTLFDESAGGPRHISLVKLSSEIAGAAAAIGTFAVEGEVHRPTQRGYIFFTLKDRAAQVGVYCPASRAQYCRVVNGERVLVTGRLSWGASRGNLQMEATEVVPVGAGAVAAMLAEVRARLAADGLIDRPRRPVPLLPKRVGVVCGADAAVRHDIQAVVDRRFPGYPLRFAEVRVSGTSAAEAMVGALADLCGDPEVEVIILARGGGDATELLPFSDEGLCRALCDCTVPVVSAIGHEADRPLCDEVADLRCGTPSMAAAAVIPDRRELETALDRVLVEARALLDRRLVGSQRRLVAADSTVALARRAERARARLDAAGGRLDLVHPRRRLQSARSELEGIARELDALSPVRVLERGYAVVRKSGGSVVRSTAEVSSGDGLDIQVADGHVAARVGS